MTISYRNDVCSNYMVIGDIPEFSSEDFEIKILAGNRIKGLLSMDYETVNGNTNIIYDISSKQSLEEIHKYSKISYADYKTLIFSLSQVIKNINEYLLDVNGLVLKKDCIYMDIERNAVDFCYNPYNKENINDGMRDLLSGLLSLIDYGDPKVVRVAYDAQKVTAADSFTMDEIISVVTIASSDMDSQRGIYEFQPEKEPEMLRESVENFKFNSEIRNSTKTSDATFFEKAQVYFKEHEPGEIFDDINELKIIKKIKEVNTKEINDSDKKEQKPKDFVTQKKTKNEKKASVKEEKTKDSRKDDDIPDVIFDMEEDINKSGFFDDYRMI